MHNDKTLKIGIGFKPFGTTFGRYGENSFSKIRQHGYDAVDYGIADTNSAFYTLDEAELKQKLCEERQAAALAGVTISQAHGPWCWPPHDNTEEGRAERLEKMKKSVVICSLLGCKYVVIHPIMPYGVHDLETGQEQETWDLNVAFFTELVAFAKQYDVTVCLENMPMRRFSLATPRQILKFVETINDEHFKICLDTGHVAVFPELSIGDAVRELGDRIKVVHVHDNMGDKDAHMWPTKGVIRWHEFVDALYEIGFDGSFSLETAPSGNCDDETFEAESIQLCQIAKSLVEKR